MDLTIFDNASDFQARVWPFLLQHEAENNLMIGLVGQLAAGKDLFTAAGERPLLALVDDGGTVAAALMTPPYRMNLSRAPDAALDLLARSLHARNVTLPGVIGPRSSAEAFSTNWARLTGRSARRGKALRIYQLDSAKPVSRAGGELCQACSTDVDLALKWMRAFAAEVNESHPPTTGTSFSGRPPTLSAWPAQPAPLPTASASVPSTPRPAAAIAAMHLHLSRLSPNISWAPAAGSASFSQTRPTRPPTTSIRRSGTSPYAISQHTTSRRHEDAARGCFRYNLRRLGTRTQGGFCLCAPHRVCWDV
jgi:hypothetical protein